MNLPFSLLMAIKYLRPRRSFVSVVTLISMIGVTLGVTVLIVVLSVMTGFDEDWRGKILDFNAHISLVEEGGLIQNPERVRRVAAQMDGVRGTAPMIEGLVLMQVGERVHTPILRGVLPIHEQNVSRVPESVTKGTFSMEAGEVVLGSGLAHRLDVDVGDIVTVHSPQSFLAADEIRLPEELRVVGVFHMGMFEFDEGFAFVSIETAQDLYEMEQGVHAIQVMLKEPMKAALVAAQLRAKLGASFHPQTWMETHRQIFAALQVEKNMMFFLLAFVVLVAAFSITNTLITLTVQKTREIGLLKALGFGDGGITSVFMWMGLVQGLVGNACGTGLALLVLRYRNGLLRFMARELDLELLPPEFYQLSQLPSHTTGSDVAVVTGLVMLFCTLAGVAPSWRAARMQPADALRHE